MATQREIKKRIRASKGIASVARALQVISANKIRRTQKLNENNSKYLDSLVEFTGGIEPKAVGGPEAKNVFLVFTPERGLCGSLPSQVTARFLDILKVNPGAAYIFIGKKGKNLTKFLKSPALAFFDFGMGNPTFAKTLPLSKLLGQQIKKDSLVNIYCVYPKFINFGRIEVALEKIYPLNFAGIERDHFRIDIEKEELLKSLELTFMKSYVYQKFLESFLSENAARMTAMTQASRNAKELSEELTHVLNQERQKQITTEILELKGGITNG